MITQRGADGLRENCWIFSTDVESFLNSENIDKKHFHWDNKFQQMLKRFIMVKIENLESRAKEALIECFQDIPFVDNIEVNLEPEQEGIRPDLHIVLHLKSEVQFNFTAEVKNNGEPRFARQVVNQVQRYLRESEIDYGIFIAPYISSRSAEICQGEGIGYVDLAGNCHIAYETIYIHKEGNTNPFSRKRYLRSLYSPKAERILRVLLSSSRKDWKLEELAAESGVSLGQVANVKKLLADQEWIDSKTVGFSLTEPLSLLEEWSQNYQYRRNKVMNFYTMLSAAEFEAKLGRNCQLEFIRCGLTGFSGSSRYAPAVRYQRVMAYVQGEIEKISKAMEIKPVESGANVTILKPYDEGVFYGTNEIDGSKVVSPIQVYLDLRSLRGRGEEAAAALLERVIKKIW